MEAVYTVQRFFHYDYIYIDVIFLIIWLIILIKNKKNKALFFGIIIAPIIYLIDAYIWWNTQAGVSFSVNTYIREYWIDGIQMPHPLGEYFWLKFGADFMMTISYALFAFPWLWIVFENLKTRNFKNTIKYTSIWFCFWLLVPLLSIILNIDNSLVHAVRHMNSQYLGWIINFIIGFGILIFIYRKNIHLVGKLFLVGVIGSLIMEAPLYLFGIRPMTFSVLIFDAIFMLNQGVPYLFLVFDKVIPFVIRKRSISNLQ
jgi:hypothetical protein